MDNTNPRLSTSQSHVMARPLTLFLNETDPQFAASLDRTRYHTLVRAQTNLALLFNASVAFSDANSLHSEFCQEFFSSPDNLALLHHDDKLTEITGENSPVSPIRICLRDTCSDIVEVDVRDVQKRGRRVLHLTAMDASYPMTLREHGQDTQLLFSEKKCGMELAEFCRPLFETEDSYGSVELRGIDEEFAKQVVENFNKQRKGEDTYALGAVYKSLEGHPKAQKLREVFLACQSRAISEEFPLVWGSP